MIRVEPAPAASNPASADAPTAARALIERQLGLLTRLAEIGMEIAEAAGRQATGAARADGGQDAPLGDPALAYARVARAVRMTVFLQARLAKDLAALDKAEGAVAAARAARRRAGLHRLVEQALAEGEPATDEDRDEDEIERLSCEAWERLRDAEDDAALLGLSFSEVVARICQDLRLSPAWTAKLVAAAGGDWDGGAGPPHLPLRAAAGSAPGRPAARPWPPPAPS